MRRTIPNVLVIALAIMVALPSRAAITEVLATGTMAYSEQIGGLATMVTRRLRIAPGEVLGWHYHPGVGALTIVKRGTLVVEDGCGGEEVSTEGQAFIEHTDRVHRGKNLGSVEIETIQTFLVPLGTPISVSAPQMCGAPTTMAECQHEGWRQFTFPRTFGNQGECIQGVTGR